MGNALKVMRVCGSGICRAGCPGTHTEVVQIKAVATVPALVVSKCFIIIFFSTLKDEETSEKSECVPAN